MKFPIKSNCQLADTKLNVQNNTIIKIRALAVFKYILNVPTISSMESRVLKGFKYIEQQRSVISSIRNKLTIIQIISNFIIQQLNLFNDSTAILHFTSFEIESGLLKS